MESFDINSKRPEGMVGNQVREQGLQRYNAEMPQVQILPCQIGYVESYYKVSKSGAEREWFEVWVVLPGKEFVKLKICGAVKGQPETLTQRAWDFCYLVTRQNPQVFEKRVPWVSNYEPFDRTTYPLCAHMPIKVAIVDNGRGAYNGYWSYEGEFLDHDTEKTANELAKGTAEAKEKADVVRRLQERHDRAQKEGGSGFGGYGQQSAPAPAPARAPNLDVAPLNDDIPF